MIALIFVSKRPCFISTANKNELNNMFNDISPSVIKGMNFVTIELLTKVS